ncbi:MAG: hypothetical protein MRY83_04590, partial [Flavobacteriales bacterium]|nr:hypothetical protein [Flavobacteriales bacterium]
QYDLNELIEDYADLDVNEGSIADMSARLQKIMYDYKISVPGSVFLIFRAFAILEGIGKQIHPHFNTYDFIKPFGKKIFSSKYSPKNIINAITEHLEQDISVWRAFPHDFREIVTKFKKGQLNFKIHHEGYGYLLKKLDSLTNRVTLAMIIVSLIIGSSITMLADFEPHQKTDYGIPYVSLAGFMGAGFFFLILSYAVIRRRKYK